MFASNQGYGQQAGQQAQQAPEFDEDSIIDSLGRGGGKAFFNADSQPGATITGTVAEVHAYQAKDFQTGELQYSKSGKPKYDMVINLIDTDAPREDQYDEGARSIYIHGWGAQLDAYRLAMRKAGINRPKPGDRMRATYKGLGQPIARGLSAPKMYEYEFTRLDDVDRFAMQDQQPPASGQTAQPAYQQPQQTGYAQPVSLGVPAQPAQPRIDVQQILQLKQLGKSPQEIAGMLGLTVDQVIAAANGQAHGSEDASDAF